MILILFESMESVFMFCPQEHMLSIKDLYVTCKDIHEYIILVYKVITHVIINPSQLVNTIE